MVLLASPQPPLGDHQTPTPGDAALPRPAQRGFLQLLSSPNEARGTSSLKSPEPGAEAGYPAQGFFALSPQEHGYMFPLVGNCRKPGNPGYFPNFCGGAAPSDWGVRGLLLPSSKVYFLEGNRPKG